MRSAVNEEWLDVVNYEHKAACPVCEYPVTRGKVVRKHLKALLRRLHYLQDKAAGDVCVVAEVAALKWALNDLEPGSARSNVPACPVCERPFMRGRVVREHLKTLQRRLHYLQDEALPMTKAAGSPSLSYVVAEVTALRWALNDLEPGSGNSNSNDRRSTNATAVDSSRPDGR